MKPLSRILPILLASILVASCAKKKETVPETGGQATHAKVSQAMLQRWMVGLINRQPTPNAESSVTIGSGVMQVQTPAESKAWTETADADSNGTQETIRFMWDGQAKVMYAHTQDPVTLADGTIADKGLLVTQFAEGNTRNKAPGSGWYAYALTRDSTATGVTGTLFGCMFDRYGAEGECGTGTFSRNDNEFHIDVVGQ